MNKNTLGLPSFGNAEKSKFMTWEWSYVSSHIELNVIMKIYLIYWLMVYNLVMIGSIWDKIEMEYMNGMIWYVALNGMSSIVGIVVIMISSLVILSTFDYLSLMEKFLLIGLITIFQFVMLYFVLSVEIIMIFVMWELVGIVSYILINFWSSKVNSGIKAIIYNKVGDSGFILIIAIVYFMIGTVGIGSLAILPLIGGLDMNLIRILIEWGLLVGSGFLHSWVQWDYSFTFSILLLCILFSKSAQYPFASWLLNAMVAPTPISALLHSSTLVICGLYIGLVMYSSLLIMSKVYGLISLLLILLPLWTMLWAMMKGIISSDVKIIIAFSTVSQLSYMFIGLSLFPNLSIFHIIVHAIFKSILFMIAGTMIITFINFQSIYQMKFSSQWIGISMMLGSSILIYSISKDIIINGVVMTKSSLFMSIILLMGIVLTSIYSMKIYRYCFIGNMDVLLSSNIVNLVTVLQEGSKGGARDLVPLSHISWSWERGDSKLIPSLTTSPILTNRSSSFSSFLRFIVPSFIITAICVDQCLDSLFISGVYFIGLISGNGSGIVGYIMDYSWLFNGISIVGWILIIGIGLMIWCSMGYMLSYMNRSKLGSSSSVLVLNYLSSLFDFRSSISFFPFYLALNSFASSFISSSILAVSLFSGWMFNSLYYVVYYSLTITILGLISIYVVIFLLA